MALFGSSSPFGASSASPFGGASPTSNPFGTSSSLSPFGANQNTSSNFGSPTLGSQTETSMFGGTRTGVFGATQASTSTFGAASAPAFGSTPSAFGSGTSIFGQKPTTPFGGFESTPGQASLFGSTTFGQSQPAFGSAPSSSSAPAFGSTMPSFGVMPFGTSSTPAFGATSTPAFGAASAPSFGATPTPAFGATSTPAFGASVSPAFGASSTPLFGSTSSSLFASSTPAFGQTSSAFGNASSPSFGSTSLFGSSGATPFGAQSTPAFGSSPSFGSSTFGSSFGSQQNGSRVASYAPSNDSEAGVSGQVGKLMSLTAMPAFKVKSFEELRWEDYEAGDKGGPPLGGQQPVAGIFGQASSPSSSAFSQTQAQNPFNAGPSSIFGSKPGLFGTPSTGAAMTPSSSPFGAPSCTPAFGQASTPSGINSPFGTGSTPSFVTGFGTSPTFGSPAAPALGSAPANPFSAGAMTAFGSNPFTQGATSSSLFSTPNQPFSLSMPAVSTPALGSSIFGSSAPLFQSVKPSGLSAPGSSIFGGLPSTSNQGIGSFGFPGLGQYQSVMGSFGAQTTPGISSLSTFTLQSSAPVAVSNPFGSLPPIPQISVGGSAAAGPAIQYGISSTPVFEKPAQVRTSSILMPRHITQKTRIRMQARGCHPKKDCPRVSFFSDVEDTPSTSKGVGFSVSRENPRAFFIRQSDQSLSKVRNAALRSRGGDATMNRNDDKDGDGMVDALGSHVQDPVKSYGVSAFEGPELASWEVEDNNPWSKATSRQDGLRTEAILRRKLDDFVNGREQASYVHGADIESLVPKLQHLDYYIQPAVPELAAKERAERGYCRKVKDFVVGREGYGCVKFFGETDIQGLDIESIIQFNKCEVLVYMDEIRKPPPGLGLNKPAEITLLNVKCLDKKSGEPLAEGVEVEKFEKRLKKKTEEQGAEFVSYIACKGEWKFRVKHFSKYSLTG